MFCYIIVTTRWWHVAIYSWYFFNEKFRQHLFGLKSLIWFQTQVLRSISRQIRLNFHDFVQSSSSTKNDVFFFVFLIIFIYCSTSISISCWSICQFLLSSPYSNNTNFVLVSDFFNESNYFTWSNGMILMFTIKNKLRFVNGTLTNYLAYYWRIT